MSEQIVELSVRVSPDEMDLLEMLIERTQSENPDMNLSVDDCVDTIFTAGLIAFLLKK